uniref:Cytochrome P450 n=1 Tax=Aegilops tauschii subsp. strangulata TaxID=200361 RepID=A0A453F369_AEGTS
AVLGGVTPASLPWGFLVCGLLCLALLRQAGKLLDMLWLRPRRLERELRAQGLRGTPYRFPVGDLKEHGRLSKEAWARPLPLGCHDISAHVAPFLYNAVEEHGRTCFSWVGPIPKVTISDPDLAKDVMSNKFGHFEKTKLPALSKLLAEGLASIDGEKWAKHRRILNPAFQLEKMVTLQRMLPAFSSCCEDLVSRWRTSLGSKGSCELDVWPELKNLTGDVISRTAFSSSHLEGRKIFQLQEEQAERLITNIRGLLIPGYLSLPTKNNRRMHQINKEIESILKNLVGKRIQAMKQGESTKDDLLSLLLESNMRQTDEHGRSSLGMTIEDVTMILYEVLRLYPPATLFSRKTYKEMEIGGITYPAGVMVELPVMFIHHDQHIWGSDVHEFKPDRFADGVSKASNDSGAFLPFGWGPRICIGQNFALLEAKMAMCMIIQSFEFELAPSYSHAPYTVITLQPMHGAQINLRAI